MRRSGSAAPSSALTTHTLDGATCQQTALWTGWTPYSNAWSCLSIGGECPVVSAENMGLFHKALERMGRGEGRGSGPGADTLAHVAGNDVGTGEGGSVRVMESRDCAIEGGGWAWRPSSGVSGPCRRHRTGRG